MNGGRLAVLGLAGALGLGTTAAVLNYASSPGDGSIVELAGDDLQAKPREEGEQDLLVADDDAGAGDDPNDTTRGGAGTGPATTGAESTANETTRGGRGTGPQTTGPAGDTKADTTQGGRGTGGRTTGGPAGDTTQPAPAAGFGGGGTDDGGGTDTGGTGTGGGDT